MVQRRRWATAAIVAVMGVTASASSARGDSASVATIRDGVEDLDTRTKVIKPHIEDGPLNVRVESERLMAIVERDRASLSTRLAIIELLGGAVDERGPAIRDMAHTMKEATWVLSMLERWYGVR